MLSVGNYSYVSFLIKNFQKTTCYLLDFYFKDIIGRLSSATSSSLSPSIGLIPRLSYYFIAQYHATLCFLKAEFTLGKFLAHSHFQRHILLLSPNSLLRQQRTYEVGKKKGTFIYSFLYLTYILYHIS